MKTGIAAGWRLFRQRFQAFALARRNNKESRALLSAPDWLLDDIGLDRAHIAHRPVLHQAPPAARGQVAADPSCCPATQIALLNGAPPRPT